LLADTNKEGLMANKYWRDDFGIAPEGKRHIEQRGIPGKNGNVQQKGFAAEGKGKAKGWDIPSKDWGIKNTNRPVSQKGQSKGWTIPSR